MKKAFVLLLLALLKIHPSISQWSLTGNTGTNPPTNFLGTIDSANLLFKVNNVHSGIIDLGVRNTSFGHRSLFSNTTGTDNTAFGQDALRSNTTGNQNTAFGTETLYSDVDGYQNTAFGYRALYLNVSGTNNTAFGLNTLLSNTSGFNNCGIGQQALQATTSGYENHASGTNTLYSNTTGYQNAGSGNSALFNNTTGYNNTATGFTSLFNNTTGSENTAHGYLALFSNTTGLGNTAIGSYALYNNTGGYHEGGSNTGIGYLSLYSNTTGNANVGTGWRPLFYNTTGIGNTGLGDEALSTNTTGSHNVGVGDDADVNASSYSNTTVIGYAALGTASDQVRVGNTSIVSIGGYQAWTNLSDGRVKRNIAQNVPGLSFINKLVPITYNLDLTAIDQITGVPTKEEKNSVEIEQQIQAARNKKEKIVFTGFIAQDVEKAAQSLNYNFDGVDAPKNEKDLYGLRYAEFVVPLVKAVQELTLENNKKDSIINTLQSEVDQILKQLNQIAPQTSSSSYSVPVPEVQHDINSTYLLQNAPNPFDKTTIIRYKLPINANKAILTVSDVSGRVLKSYVLSNKSSGEITIFSGELAPGNYFYSLKADNKIIDTKQMILTK